VLEADVGRPLDVRERELLALDRCDAGRIPVDRGGIVGHRNERLAEPGRARSHADLEEGARRGSRALLAERELGARGGGPQESPQEPDPEHGTPGG